MSTAMTDRPAAAPAHKIHPDSGRPYVVQDFRVHFRGRALDTVLAGGFAAALVALTNHLITSLAFGSLSLALLTYEWAAALVLVAVWFLGLFIFGAVTGVTGTPGDALTGTRSVRISDGSRAGAWTGGWRAVKWSFSLMLIATALSEPVSFESRFVGINVKASAGSM